MWAPATVTEAHALGTFDVQWCEEGEPFSFDLPRKFLRFPKSRGLLELITLTSSSVVAATSVFGPYQF